MDDFNNDFSYDCGGFGGGYDSSSDNSYTYEPDPVPDFSIDPLAFVPGAVLDCSKPSWGASLAIQQGVEMMAQQMAQQMTESAFEEMSYPEQNTWLQRCYYEVPQASDRKAHLELARADPIPAQFYSKVDLYASRQDLMPLQKYWCRHLDAVRTQREYAEQHGLGELLEDQDLMVLKATGRYPLQCYPKVNLFADHTNLTEEQREYSRTRTIEDAWYTQIGRIEPPCVLYADYEEENAETAVEREAREKLAALAKKYPHYSEDQLRHFQAHMARLDEENIEFERKWGLVGRKLPTWDANWKLESDSGLEREAQKEYAKNLKGILSLTWNSLKNSLKKNH